MVRVSSTSIKKSEASTPTVAFSEFPRALMPSLDDTMSMVRKGNQINSVSFGGADRPSNLMFRMQTQSQYWYMYAMMDWLRSEVSILSTLILRSCSELFRYGLNLKPRFAYKCESCGHESQYLISKCPTCGSMRLRRPDETQKDYFRRPNGKSFLDEANDNGQPLITVLRSYADSEYQNNQAYTLCVTGEIFDSRTGKLLYNCPMEFIAQDPKYVRYLYDEQGKPGTTFAFTRDERKVLINLDTDPDAVQIYSEEGKELIPAVWIVGESYGGTGDFTIYAKEEVYQDHWFRPSMTYGVPIAYDIEDDLLTYHFIEKSDLKKFKYGFVRKVLVLPGFNEQDAEDIASGITDVLAVNDNSIPIVCLPPQVPGVAEMKAQVLDLSPDSAQDRIAVKDEIRGRVCAHWGTPNLFVGDAEASGGMNNESQQITVFDRYLLDKYNFIDRQCKWIMSKFPMITDWELELGRPSKAYTDVRRRIDLMQEAQGMKQLGFALEFIDGEFRYSERPLDQLEAITSMSQQGLMDAFPGMKMAHGMSVGGLVPGDGEGPPDKGTLRRDDPEVAQSKDDIDLAKREAESTQES